MVKLLPRWIPFYDLYISIYNCRYSLIDATPQPVQDPHHHRKLAQQNWYSIANLEGRDKLCKILQHVFLLLSKIFEENDYYSLKFNTLYRKGLFGYRVD